MTSYYNPYSGETFLGFFSQLMKRALLFITGRLPIDSLVSDEIQIVVLAGVAASTALLGCFLVLRKMAMLANALSHTILIGIVLAYLLTLGSFYEMARGYAEPLHLTAMLWASLFVGVLTTYLTEFFNKTLNLQEDASIGIVFSSLFALGVVLVTALTRNAHIGTEVVMGNADALQLKDAKLVYLTLGVDTFVILLFFKEFKITTFDQQLSRGLGISPVFYNYLLMTLVSATAISAFRAVGVLMVLAFITGPPLAARLLTHRLNLMIVFAIGIGVMASVSGVAFSRHLLTCCGIALSTGGVVVCFIFLVFITVAIAARLRHFISKRA